MKKNLILIFFMVCFSATSFAQNTFIKGDKIINLGLGLGSTLYAGSYYKTTVPPVSASFEMGIIDNLFDEKSSIGVGGYMGYTSAKYEYYNWGYKYSSIIFGGRGSFHYQLVDKLDTYAGLMLGYNVMTSKEFGTNSGYSSSDNGGILTSYYIGGRYYLSDNFAAMLELGYGIAYINFGVALKF